jgi:hypothetical protein
MTRCDCGRADSGANAVAQYGYGFLAHTARLGPETTKSGSGPRSALRRSATMSVSTSPLWRCHGPLAPARYRRSWPSRIPVPRHDRPTQRRSVHTEAAAPTQPTAAASGDASPSASDFQVPPMRRLPNELVALLGRFGPHQRTIRWIQVVLHEGHCAADHYRSASAPSTASTFG